LPLNLMMLKIN